jgi:hypothetical protein
MRVSRGKNKFGFGAKLDTGDKVQAGLQGKRHTRHREEAWKSPTVSALGSDSIDMFILETDGYHYPVVTVFYGGTDRAHALCLMSALYPSHSEINFLKPHSRDNVLCMSSIASWNRDCSVPQVSGDCKVAYHGSPFN